MPAQFAYIATFYAVAYIAIMEAMAAVAVVAGSSSIMGNSKLRAWCVIGAVMGGTLAVCIWMPKNMTPSATFRELLIKFTGSTLLGLSLGPWLTRCCEITIDEDGVIVIPAMLAAFGVWVIHMTIPVCEKNWPRVTEWVAAKVGKVVTRIFGGEK